MSGRNGATAGSLRELLQVAVPLILSSGSVSLMYVVDRMLLTWYSEDALAASLPAGMAHWTLISLMFGTAQYATAFVAQYEGAGRPDRVAAVLWQTVYFSLAMSLPLLVFVPLAGTFFAWMGHEPVIQQLETEYFQILCAGGSVFVLQTGLSCFYSGRGKTLVILWANLTSTIANGVLDYLLIFGVGGLPALGIRGAAIANVIVGVYQVAFYAVCMLLEPSNRRYRLLEQWRFDRELFQRLLRYGLPNGLHVFLDVICLSLFVMLVGSLGKEELAATNLAFNLNSLAFLPMLGLGTAVMTLVGRRIGEGRPELAVRTTWIAFLLSVAYILGFAVIYVGFPEVILRPFAWNSDPEEFSRLRRVVVLLLRFVALYSLFDVMNVIFSSAVRGAGDTRFPMLFNVTAGMLLAVLPTWVMQQYFGGGLVAAWSAITLYLVVLGLGLGWRFVDGKWKTMRVIEVAATE